MRRIPVTSRYFVDLTGGGFLIDDVPIHHTKRIKYKNNNDSKRKKCNANNLRIINKKRNYHNNNDGKRKKYNANNLRIINKKHNYHNNNNNKNNNNNDECTDNTWAILQSLTNKHQTFHLTKDKYTFGRDDSCDLVVRHRLLSRTHAIIQRNLTWTNGINVKDSSTNGIWTNCIDVKYKKLRKSEWQLLLHGDEIHFINPYQPNKGLVSFIITTYKSNNKNNRNNNSNNYIIDNNHITDHNNNNNSNNNNSNNDNYLSTNKKKRPLQPIQTTLSQYNICVQSQKKIEIK